MAIKNIVKAQPPPCTALGQAQGWERGRGGSPGGARGGHKDTEGRERRHVHVTLPIYVISNAFSHGPETVTVCSY